MVLLQKLRDISEWVMNSLDALFPWSLPAAAASDAASDAASGSDTSSDPNDRCGTLQEEEPIQFIRRSPSPQGPVTQLERIKKLYIKTCPANSRHFIIVTHELTWSDPLYTVTRPELRPPELIIRSHAVDSLEPNGHLATVGSILGYHAHSNDIDVAIRGERRTIMSHWDGVRHELKPRSYPQKVMHWENDGVFDRGGRLVCMSGFEEWAWVKVGDHYGREGKDATITLKDPPPSKFFLDEVVVTAIAKLEYLRQHLSGMGLPNTD